MLLVLFKVVQAVAAVQKQRAVHPGDRIVPGRNAALHRLDPVNAAGLAMHGEQQAKVFRRTNMGANSGPYRAPSRCENPAARARNYGADTFFPAARVKGEVPRTIQSSSRPAGSKARFEERGC